MKEWLLAWRLRIVLIVFVVCVSAFFWAGFLMGLGWIINMVLIFALNILILLWSKNKALTLIFTVILALNALVLLGGILFFGAIMAVLT